MLEIPSRAKTCKGIITGWDLGAPLDELLRAMVVTSNVKAVERLKRKFYCKEECRLKEGVTHTIMMTWEGNLVLSEIRLYGNSVIRLQGSRSGPL